jgi:hypothetical protein
VRACLRERPRATIKRIASFRAIVKGISFRFTKTFFQEKQSPLNSRGI